MLTRLLSFVAVLVLACASTPAFATARAPERVSAPLSEQVQEWKSAHRGSVEAPATASKETPALGDCRVRENWHPPLKVKSDPCLYAYANPTVYVDPTGRRACDGIQCALAQAREQMRTSDGRARIDALMVRNQDQQIDAGARTAGVGMSTAEGIFGLAQTTSDMMSGGALLDALGEVVGFPSTGAFDRSVARANALGHPVDSFYHSIDDPLQAASAANDRGDKAGTAFHEGRAAGNFINAVLGARGILGLAKSGFKMPGTFDPATITSGIIEDFAVSERVTRGSTQPVVVVEAPGNAGSIQKGAVTWVDEGGDMRAGKSAGMPSDAYTYQSGATGARSNPETGRSQAPLLEYKAADGSVARVKFDGQDGAELIDRKTAIHTGAKTQELARRQSAALNQNGMIGTWEVPSASEAARANKVLNSAGVTNITVKVKPREPSTH